MGKGTTAKGAFVAAAFGAIGVAYYLSEKPPTLQAQASPFQFHLQEATIDDVHRGIQEGQITCRRPGPGLCESRAGLQRRRQPDRHRGHGAEYLPDYAEYKAAVARDRELAGR